MRRVQVKIPYEYTKQIIPKYCRNPRGVVFNSEISVSIHKVNAEQAPIAIREFNQHFNDKTEKYEPATTDYRWYRKKLWVLHSFSRYCHAPYETQTTEQFAKDPYPMTNGMSYYHAYRTQQENRCCIMAWARNILLIDGMRWQQIAEPRYVIHTFGLGHNHGHPGTSLSSTNSYNSNISKVRYFRIDQHDLALDTAIATALNRGDDKALSFIEKYHETFDILIPGALRLNPNKEHGNGDPFINKLEGMIDQSPTKEIAGLLVMAGAIALIALKGD